MLAVTEERIVEVAGVARLWEGVVEVNGCDGGSGGGGRGRLRRDQTDDQDSDVRRPRRRPSSCPGGR